MKAVKLALLVLILLLPVVSAELNIDPFSSKVYSYGSKILLSGSVVQHASFRAKLDFSLLCGSSNQTAKLVSLLLNLKADEPTMYSQLVTVPKSLTGSCNIRMELFDTNGNILETKESYAFDISNDLSGNFKSMNSEYQLGDVFHFQGAVSRADGFPVDGVAVLKFRQGENIILIDSVEVVSGFIDYSRTLSLLPAGNYALDIEVSDNFGNTHGFIDVAVFKLSNDITIEAGFDKTSYEPGSSLVISGLISSSIDKELRDVEVEIVFENDKVVKNLLSSNEGFTYTYKIVPNIKSGKHLVAIKAMDVEGNYGEKIVNFNVNAFPTSLLMSLDSNSVNPGAKFGVFVDLMDQANDPISSNVVASLLDSKNNVVSSKLVRTSAREELFIPDGTAPNEWKVRVEGFGLSNELPVRVNEYKKLDIKLENNALVVNNTGNVPYNSFLEVIGNGKKSGKNVKLGVGKTAAIKLSDIFDAGLYNVDVPFSGKSFSNVPVEKKNSLFGRMTGNVVANVSSGKRPYMFYSSLLLIACCLIYIVFRKSSLKNSSSSEFNKQEFEKGQKKLEELRARGIRKDRPVEYGKATKEDIKDFKNRMVSQFNEDEKNKQKEDYFKNQRRVHDDGKPKGGLFNMFN